MSNTEHELTSKSVVKKHGNKRKPYWCAPRRVKSTTIVANADDSLVQNKKSKKSHRKKKRKNIKSLRRIDILAQPKSVKYKLEHNTHSSNVNESTKKYSTAKRSISTNQKPTICPRKSLQIKKFNKAHELPKNFRMSSTLKDYSPIVLPKKIGVRLFSLVKKKLKELTNSKDM
ncbi:PREDICTED: uncharacterized protein LOC108545235 [Eufriesea mexicana]|uniref:uncharacterized protein LOC108545235 n=1 Tax=Eufriesea mexicana TaxID=516756 RepID=UPI00083C58E8|nr:PREDICTED: uncharacterized protein LOC108545235 [Eufriesea mexicana]